MNLENKNASIVKTEMLCLVTQQFFVARLLLLHSVLISLSSCNLIPINFYLLKFALSLPINSFTIFTELEFLS